MEQCAKGGFSEEQIQCMDPNLRTDDCTETIKAIDKAWVELQSYLLAPMSTPKEDEAKDKDPYTNRSSFLRS